MWRGGIIWQSLQWAVRGFLVPKWSRFWSTWGKAGFDLLALVHRMLATILASLKKYRKPQSLPQGAYSTDTLITRTSECQTESQPTFIWSLKALPWTASSGSTLIYCHGLGVTAGLGLSVVIAWQASSHCTQSCRFLLWHVITLILSFSKKGMKLMQPWNILKSTAATQSKCQPF